MASAQRNELVLFRGASGASYQFAVVEWDVKFGSVGAVYFITKKLKGVGDHSHEKIYVGETAQLGPRLAGHERESCFRSQGADRKCIHLCGSPTRRSEIEADLIRAYRPPCNQTAPEEHAGNH